MKKPKFNIGDKVRATIRKEIDGIMMTGQVDWYVASAHIDINIGTRGVQYLYGVVPELSAYGYASYHLCKHFDEKELTLLERAKYDAE